jgi:hypothetical protein
LASLQARSSLRSAHPLLFINKLISLSAFIILLGAGWVAVNYLKNEIITRWHGATESKAPSNLNNSAVQIDDAASSEAKPLSAPVRLVYSCSEDKDYYHASTHLPSRCERTALSEEAALRRGLKHCRVCLPE